MGSFRPKGRAFGGRLGGFGRLHLFAVLLFLGLLALPADVKAGTGASETIVAVFQGCQVGRAGRPNFCTLISKGVKLYVYGGGGTSSEVMAQLSGFEPGRRLSLRGWCYTLYEGAAALTIDRLEATLRSRYDRLLLRLQGQWQSVDDPLDQFAISGAERINSYAGAGTSVEYVSIAASCGGFSASGPYFSAWDPTEGIELCYEIEEISDQVFSLIYLPRGNRLQYARRDPSGRRGQRPGE